MRSSRRLEERDKLVPILDATDGRVQRRHDQRRVFLQLLTRRLLFPSPQSREPVSRQLVPLRVYWVTLT